jgi:hypothetical protein
MRRVSLTAALVAGALLLAAPLRAEDETLTRPRIRKLDLGLYGRVYSAGEAVRQMPRFESSVEVTAPAPLGYDETMALHWKQWNLSTGSIYGKGYNLQNGGCPTCVNILPAIEKLIDLIKKK